MLHIVKAFEPNPQRLTPETVSFSYFNCTYSRIPKDIPKCTETVSACLAFLRKEAYEIAMPFSLLFNPSFQVWNWLTDFRIC